MALRYMIDSDTLSYVMTLEKLNELIAGGEDERLEYKETTGQRVEACRTLCTFLNGVLDRGGIGMNERIGCILRELSLEL